MRTLMTVLSLTLSFGISHAQTPKCGGFNPDGTIVKCVAPPTDLDPDGRGMIPSYALCMNRMFEGLNRTHFELENGALLTMMPGSGFVAYYHEGKQYIYTASGNVMEVGNDGKCKTGARSGSVNPRLFNDVMRDFASQALAELPVGVKGIPNMTKGIDDKARKMTEEMQKKRDEAKDACRDFLKERRVPGDDTRRRSIPTPDSEGRK